MCGFAGFLTADVSALGSPQAVATRMALAVIARGPNPVIASAARQSTALVHPPWIAAAFGLAMTGEWRPRDDGGAVSLTFSCKNTQCVSK